MTWILMTWLMVGIMLSVLHAAALWHAAPGTSGWVAVIGLPRLLGVTMALTGAAVWGGLLPAATGWAMGFVVIVVIMLLRKASSSRKSVACAGRDASAQAPLGSAEA